MLASVRKRSAGCSWLLCRKPTPNLQEAKGVSKMHHSEVDRQHDMGFATGKVCMDKRRAAVRWCVQKKTWSVRHGRDAITKSTSDEDRAKLAYSHFNCKLSEPRQFSIFIVVTPFHSFVRWIPSSHSFSPHLSSSRYFKKTAVSAPVISFLSATTFRLFSLPEILHSICNGLFLESTSRV